MEGKREQELRKKDAMKARKRGGGIGNGCERGGEIVIVREGEK